MSGSGKSTVVHELARRGYRAVDADDGLMEALPDGRQRWREDAVEEVLSTDDAPVLFMAGCEDNMVRFLPRFDRVILLSAPVETLLERLATRSNNPYGKHPAELARVLDDVENVEPVLRDLADAEIVTTRPVHDVVSEVLRVAGVLVDRARPADAVSVVALLDDAAERQRDLGMPLWTPRQFDDEVEEGIFDGGLYVARREGTVIGCFLLDQRSSRMSAWLLARGRVPAEGANVGRLAVARSVRGQNLGLHLLNAARRLAAYRGLAYLWLDCPADNQRLCRYYLEAGFSYAGGNDLPGPNDEPWVSSVFERATGT
jgi:dephospho-CoA kinase/GNAT superfamily N-acetyltransferase